VRHETNFPRILLVTDSLNVGGVEKVVIHLANSLTQIGYQIGIAAEPGGDLWSEVDSRVTCHHAPLSSRSAERIRWINWIRRVIHSEGYSIVHAHQRGVALLSGLATLGTKVPVVEHVHNIFLPVTRRRISFRGDWLIACGPAVERMLIENYHRPAARISLIPNSVPDIGYGLDLSLPVSTNPGLPRIIALARLSAQKDPTRFVRVIDELNRDKETVSAVWVGSGELRDEAEALQKNLGVRGLQFTGESMNIRGQLIQSDLMLMTSLWEGLPLSLLEAMSLGRGAIVSDVGSCRDAVEDGFNGAVYDPDASPSVIADLVRTSLRGDTLERWGRNSRTRYETEFKPELMVNRVERVYESVLKGFRASNYSG
jgi:glycosyltransferase involved in cell wall biosynthesis